MDNSRISLVSFLQTFGIVLVVIGHSSYGAPVSPWWHTWIYSFHMPLFMFISGLLLRYGCEKRKMQLSDLSLWGKQGFIWKKIKRLMIPYWFISTLAYFPKVLLSSFATRPATFSFAEYFNMLIFPWDNVIIFFWFLPTLFMIFLFVVFGAKCLKRLSIHIPHSICLICLLILHLFNPLADIDILNINGVISYLLYFILGYYSYHLVMDRIPYRHIYIYSGGVVVFSIVLIFFLPPFVGKDVLTALTGILFSIFLANIYEKNSWHFLDHLFGASYAIYLFSWFPQTASQQIFLGITHVAWQVGSILAIITGVYIPLLVYKWISKYKYDSIGKYVAVLTGLQ